MKSLRKKCGDPTLWESFPIDCTQCLGLCCKALYFSKLDGFPQDKPAGVACVHLQKNCRCMIHQDLVKKQMKGCLGYDCQGAGQLSTGLAKRHGLDEKTMFQLFLNMIQLQQMHWYVCDALSLLPAASLESSLRKQAEVLRKLTRSNPEVLTVDLEALRHQVNPLLKAVIQLVQKEIPAHKKRLPHYMGVNLSQQDLSGMDFSMCAMIACDLRESKLFGANFLGADLRDADMRGSDLSDSFYLTQAQLNSAIGNASTKLPYMLSRPSHWNHE